MRFLKRATPSPAMAVAFAALLVATAGVALAQNEGLAGPKGELYGCARKANVVDTLQRPAGGALEVFTS